MSKLLRVMVKGPALFRHRVRAWLWGRILRCPGFSAGDGCLVIGERNIALGKNFRAGRNLWLEAVAQYQDQELDPCLKIGERFSASDSVHVACAFEVEIGDDVLVGSKVHITDHNHGQYQGDDVSSPFEPPARRRLAGRPVRIGHRVFLADGVVVLPGADIGDGAVVAANSVVRGRLEPDTIYAGAPARPVKRFDPQSRTWVRAD